MNTTGIIIVIAIGAAIFTSLVVALRSAPRITLITRAVRKEKDGNHA